MIYLTTQFDISSRIPDELLPFVTMYVMDQQLLPDILHQTISDGKSHIITESCAKFHNKPMCTDDFTVAHGDIVILITYSNSKYHYIAIEICNDQFNTQFDDFVQEISDDNLIEYTEENVDVITNLCVFIDIFDFAKSVGISTIKDVAPELLNFRYK